MDPLNAKLRDRADGGRALARRLEHYAHRRDVLVLGLPRGGVVTAAEVADALGAPLDVLVIRKLGVPGHEELAMGAIGPRGVRVINEDIVRDLAIIQKEMNRVTTLETREQERRETLFRGGRPPLDLAGRTVILVDDGLATGATMLAGIAAATMLHAAQVVVAVPVAARASLAAVRQKAAEVVCVMTGDPFMAVGYWYEEFDQTSDGEVKSILERRHLASSSST
jgi:predicted phosphoribosyltransferase